jgi:hypothetical protein
MFKASHSKLDPTSGLVAPAGRFALHHASRNPQAGSLVGQLEVENFLKIT